MPRPNTSSAIPRNSSSPGNSAGVSRHPHPALMRKVGTNNAQLPLTQRALGKGGMSPTHISKLQSAVATTPSFPKTDPWMCDLSSDSSSFVVIHVHDENNKISKDFYCKRSVLLREMRYFRCYVSEMGNDQDEYDISVHCDSTVFQWLVEYVHAPMRNLPTPILDNVMVVSALISADFLQMTSVVPDILQFVHNHVSEIVRLPISLDCIRRPLLEKLAACFTPESLLMMRDRKDKLSSSLHLYKLKTLLSAKKSLLRCRYCGKLYSTEAPGTLCLAAPQIVDYRGTLQGLHSPDPSWQVTTYVMHMHRLGVPWCQIYWRMWALVNYDTCGLCQKPFAYAHLNTGCVEAGPHVLSKVQHSAEKEFIKHVIEKHPDTQVPSNRDCVNIVTNNCDAVPVLPAETIELRKEQQQPAVTPVTSSSSSSLRGPPPPHRTAPRVDLIRENDGIRMLDLLRRFERSRDDCVDTFLQAQDKSRGLTEGGQSNSTTFKGGGREGMSGILTSPSCNTRGRQNLSQARRGSAKAT